MYRGHENEHKYTCTRVHSRIYDNNNLIFNYFILFINCFIYEFHNNKNKIHVYPTRTSLEIKDNFKSALPTNKKTISNATMNLIESLILTRDERWWHA